MEEAGGSIASERALSLSEDKAEVLAIVRLGVAKSPFVNAILEGVAEAGRYITIPAKGRKC